MFGLAGTHALNAILPSDVAVSSTNADVSEAGLFPEEMDAVVNAVPRRRSEFATGRACARAALEYLGVPPQAIPVASDGRPLWPEGIVGSITHCEGYRACAVAHESHLAAIGIDAEPDRPLPQRVLHAIAGEAELSAVVRLHADDPQLHWDSLLFSAKESLYKAWYPLTGRRLAFEDAEVDIDPDANTFSANIAGEGDAISGRWAVEDGLILTAVSVFLKHRLTNRRQDSCSRRRPGCP